MSRPPRARGLKLVKNNTLVQFNNVAPSAGAWIETSSTTIMAVCKSSRALRGRVD